jgi:hypothetical protein
MLLVGAGSAAGTTPGLPGQALTAAPTPAVSLEDGAAARPPAREAASVGDRVIARTYLPSAQRIHGELVLARRGAALVMDTLLYSHSLRRGVERIRKKELYHWPADGPGGEDSARYLQALELAKRHVLGRFEHAAPDDAGAARDPRPRLLIEFALDGADARVVFYDVEVEATTSGFVVRDRRPIVTVESSTAYVARAIQIQAEEGFDRPIADLERSRG